MTLAIVSALNRSLATNGALLPVEWLIVAATVIVCVAAFMMAMKN